MTILYGIEKSFRNKSKREKIIKFNFQITQN